MAVKIGFCSMKGGVGKSTLALLASTLLHYERGLPVTIVDCDNPQYSIVNMRQREGKYVGENEGAMRRVASFYEGFDGHQLRIVSYTPQSLSVDMDKFLSEDSEDKFIIVDFPGRWSEGNLAVLALRMDYIISPIEPIVHSLAASISFVNSLIGFAKNEALQGRYALKKAYFVWNKVKKQAPAHARVMEQFEQNVLPNLGVELFDSTLYESVRYSKEFSKSPDDEFLLSTLLPPANYVRERTGIDDFVSEVISKCV